MEQSYHHTAKRLTRSSKDKVFGGICGGLADYLDIDPVLVRVLYVGLTLLSGAAFGIILYLIAWIIIPLSGGEASASQGERAHAHHGSRLSGRRMLGVLFIVVGAIILLASALPFSWYFSEAQIIGPILLILAGVILLMWKRDHHKGEETAQAYTTTAAGDAAGTPRVEDAQFTEEQVRPVEDSAPRRMFRLERDRKLAGVCSGLGEYFNIDPTIIRIFWVMLVLVGGSGILLYLIMWLVMPLKVEPGPVKTGEVQ